MTGMDDLATWLRAQLDEDERDIRLADALGAQASAISHDQLLAEVDAKRRIIDEYFVTNNDDGKLEFEVVIFPLFALPYADRPGYLQEWRP